MAKKSKRSLRKEIKRLNSVVDGIQVNIGLMTENVGLIIEHLEQNQVVQRRLLGIEES